MIKKKILSLLLVITMVIMTIPVDRITVFATDISVSLIFKCGGNICVGLDVNYYLYDDDSYATSVSNGGTTTDEYGKITISEIDDAKYLKVVVNSDDYYVTEKLGQIVSILADTEVIVSEKSDQAALTFNTVSPINQWVGEKYTNTATGGSVDENNIVYSITSGGEYASINASTGEVIPISVGTITVKAYKAGNDTYKPVEASYSVTFEKETVSPFVFENENPSNIYYEGSNQTYTNVIDSAISDYGITYSVEKTNADSNPINATINETTGEVTITGPTVITVTAKIENNAKYNDISKSYTLTVKERVNRGEVTFSVSNPSPQWVGQNYTNVASCGGSSTGFVYSIIDGNENATINANTGELTPIKTGTVTVKATIPQDADYFEAYETYTVTFEKKNLTKVEYTDSSITIEYGKDKYTNNSLVMEDNSSNPVGTIDKTYSITETAVAEINASTGELTFNDGKVGNFTVNVTCESDLYNTSYASFYVTVEYAEQPNTECTVSGKKYDFESQSLVDIDDYAGWYATYNNGVNGIEIKAPATYQISLSNSISSSNVWANSVSIINEGSSYDVYLRNSTGGITDKIIVSAKLDASAPSNLSVEVISPVSALPVNENLMKYFFKETAVVRLSATDYLSGVTEFYYRTNSTDEFTCVNSGIATENGVSTYNIMITGPYDGNVEFYAVDAVGHRSTTKDETGKNIVIENVNPQVSLTYSGHETGKIKINSGNSTATNVTAADSDTRFIYKGNVQLRIDVEEDYFYGADVKVEVKKDQANYNGYTQSGWSRTGSVNYCIVEFTEDGVYEVSVKYKDKSGNPMDYDASYEYDSKTGTYEYKSNIFVIDNKEPLISASYDKEQMRIDNVYFYNNDMNVTFKVTEANFYTNDIIVKVNGVIANNVSWSKSGANWIGKLKLSGDGEYVVTANYTDRSTNVMQPYTSDKIVIDTVNPVIKVAYTNKDIKNTISGTAYYSSNQSAVITITEKNFSPSDVECVVTAVDADGNAVSISEYSSYLSRSSSWTSNGEVHKATINFNNDANYVINIKYKDLSKRTASEYNNKFVVDKAAPKITSINYSNSILDTIINSTATRFYNNKINVTLQVEDKTSGINRINYSFIKAIGSSGKNFEVKNKEINNANIVRNGSITTISFDLPENIVNQMNGQLEFEIIDNAEISSIQKENTVLIVDNIAPNITVTYNNPVAEVDGTSYYNGNIDVTLRVDEANFYSEDINVNVTDKDGNPYVVQVNWTDENADIHIGRFSITNDGSYKVAVSYTDKSNNTMTDYVSGNLVLDTIVPTVSIAQINPNMAYNDEQIGFTITAKDTNIDLNTFKPLLVAVVKDENGKYVKKEIALGEVTVSEDGTVLSYKLDNLTLDAIYTLTCAVTDKAGHTYTSVLLDNGEEIDNIRFSVNRDGSTFALGSVYTEDMVSKYYTYSVEEDLIIEEVNVDPVDTYSISINGKEIEEGQDYSTEQSDNTEEWSKRTYTVKKELFETEGEYNVVVQSKDKTETVAYSDVKDVKLAFVVDKTAPVVTVSGIADGGRYQTDSQAVSVIPTDAGGKLGYLKVEILDEDDKLISTAIDYKDEELLDKLNEGNGTITFNLSEGTQQKVHIICDDVALNSSGSGNRFETTYSDITVSSNAFTVFLQSDAFKWVVAGGATAVVGTSAASVVVIRKRKIRKLNIK